MKIDLHTHTLERSPCSRVREEMLIRTAIKYEIDGLVITDHDSLISPQRVSELNRRFSPFRVFGGVEISLPDEHVVVLGVHDLALVEVKWEYGELIEFVRGKGGFSILAHPYRYREYLLADLESHPPDALELYSLNTPPHAVPRIYELAKRLQTRLVANSDAHLAKCVGIYYNDFSTEITNDDELVQALTAGHYELGWHNERLEALYAEYLGDEAEEDDVE